MSSESPTRVDSLVIGEGWKAAVVAKAFGAESRRVALLDLPEPIGGPRLGTVVAHAGNGESPENARRVFGRELAGRLWEVSEASLARAGELGAEVAGGAEECRVAWIAGGDREAELLEASAAVAKDARWDTTAEWLKTPKRRFPGALIERGLKLGLEPLASHLHVKLHLGGVGFTRAKRLDAIEKAGTLESRVRYTTEAGEEAAIEASVVTIVSEALPPALFPWLQDKWIPVTLTTADYPASVQPPAALALFNGGADFAVRQAEGLRLGSFRNLYEDKAVGVRRAPDPATLRGVSAFFSGLGWVPASPPLATALTVESLSCDGVPIVGAIPDRPGITVVGCFAARPQNFLFEVARRLAGGVLKGETFSGLEIFSTKRFL